MKNCSIENCENKYLCKGFCKKHYQKNKKYGDPLAGKNSQINKEIELIKKRLISLERNQIHLIGEK
jgi:hypothetical protein